MKKLKSLFSPIRVEIKKNDEVNLGKLQVKIFYNRIDVYIQNHNGQPLLKDINKWKVVWFRVRDVKGRIVFFERGISRDEIERTVNLSESKISIIMPQGVWQLEINLKEDKGKWLSQRKPLVIDKGSVPSYLIFK